MSFDLNIENSPAALEVFGVLLGDGCLSKYFANCGKRNRNNVIITGNIKKDYDYLCFYIKPLIEETFPITCTVVRRKDGCLNLVMTKKELFEWFVKNGFPIGKKGKYLKIPDHIILMSIEKQNYVMRGLFDTDGCMYARKDEGYRYPHIKITTISKLMREQMRQILRVQGISAYIHKEDVVVRGIRNVKIWFNLIGSRNQRNLNKYSEWLKTGRIVVGQ